MFYLLTYLLTLKQVTIKKWQLSTFQTISDAFIVSGQEKCMHFL